MFTSYQDALAALHNRPRSSKKDTMMRMQNLLKPLNHPEKQLPQIVHITGTNGKGSTATMTASMLVTQGLKTGLFISPFIEDFLERIQIDQVNLSQENFVDLMNDIYPLVTQYDQEQGEKFGAITEFELLTLLMLQYFSDQQVDVAVVEVGIGGRYDSTNVFVNQPTIVGITTVGLDHQEMLGDSLEAIASQKAGLIQPESRVILGQTISDDLVSAFQAEARHPVTIAKATPFQTPLQGAHQQHNKDLAVALVRLAVPQITSDTIQVGLNRVAFPARFEALNDQVIIDGAHNLEGMQALIRHLEVDFEDENLHIIVGSLADKHLESVLSQLMNHPNWQIHLVHFTGPNQRPSMDVASAAQQYGVTFFENWQAAYQSLIHQTTNKIIFTGSLYFVSEVRAQLYQE